MIFHLIPLIILFGRFKVELSASRGSQVSIESVAVRGAGVGRTNSRSQSVSQSAGPLSALS